MDKPEVRRIVVFSKGTANGLKGSMAIGGHIIPNSKVGARLLWKYAQKKEKKNITSETINNSIPQRIPFSTRELCQPCNLASRLISRHH